MSPLLQCSIVLVGMAVGYKVGGVFGTLLAVVSGGAGLRQYMQVNILLIFTLLLLSISIVREVSAGARGGWMVRQW